MAGKFELNSSSNGKFFFNLKAGNGQVILSSEMYDTRSGAENGIESVKTNAGDDARYGKRTSSKGDPYFVLKAADGQEIGRSEMYSSPGAMETGISSVKENAPGASLMDTTTA